MAFSPVASPFSDAVGKLLLWVKVDRELSASHNAGRELSASETADRELVASAPKLISDAIAKVHSAKLMQYFLLAST